jgi:hypothetical protein
MATSNPREVCTRIAARQEVYLTTYRGRKMVQLLRIGYDERPVKVSWGSKRERLYWIPNGTLILTRALKVDWVFHTRVNVDGKVFYQFCLASAPTELVEENWLRVPTTAFRAACSRFGIEFKKSLDVRMISGIFSPIMQNVIVQYFRLADEAEGQIERADEDDEEPRKQILNEEIQSSFEFKPTNEHQVLDSKCRQNLRAYPEVERPFEQDELDPMFGKKRMRYSDEDSNSCTALNQVIDVSNIGRDLTEDDSLSFLDLLVDNSIEAIFGEIFS